MSDRIRSRSLTIAVSAVLASVMLVGASVAPAAAAKDYKNCTALNRVYPHGVGKPNAVDHVSGHTQRVTNFKRSTKLYNANSGKDRDHDKIACERL